MRKRHFITEDSIEIKELTKDTIDILALMNDLKDAYNNHRLDVGENPNTESEPYVSNDVDV